MSIPSPGTYHLPPCPQALAAQSSACTHTPKVNGTLPLLHFGPCLTILQHSVVSVCPASTHLPGSGSLLTRTQTWLCSDTCCHHSMGSPRERQCLVLSGITCSSCPRQENDVEAPSSRGLGIICTTPTVQERGSSCGLSVAKLSHLRRAHGTAHVLPQVLSQELGHWQNGSRKTSFQHRGVSNNPDEGL